jgi:hypothetical protein
MAKTLHATAMTRAADYSRTYHHVVVPHDVTIEDLTRPGYWAHHTARLSKGDLVDVLSEDDGLDVQLRVTGKGTGYVEMRVIRAWQREQAADEDEELGDVSLSPPDGYIVNHAPKTGWRVLTKEPHQEISRNHTSKLHAIQAAVAHAAKANGQAA